MTEYRKDPAAIEKLTPEQFAVTQNAATERAFTGEYWDNHEDGLYVDIVSGEPLFASVHKYDSRSGWPSFTVPVDPANVVLKSDNTFGMVRTEVRSAHGDSHLGHVFDDGPADQGGLRYCINSAAMRFVPRAELEKSGYGEFASLFTNSKESA
jgi:peptide-methionine (R)-S-oxide reductase